ncbi:MAG: ribonuclease J [Rhodospirillales bacterium]
MTSPALHFLPLGGAGEIGMNLNLYEYGGKWLMVDLGVSFGEDDVPGIDVVMPDPAFIIERKDNLAGIVLTHAHEDHLGAVAWLWPFLRCPVYATPFAAHILMGKLKEAGLDGEVPVEIHQLGGRFDVGPFNIELITLTHSIPEPNALAIRTPAGCVLHTGDWKFDANPVIGETTDTDRLRELGDEGILAMVCDSTNVFNPGEAGSEGDVQDSLVDLIAGLKNRVAVACFASNVARLSSIARAARECGREVALVGRSMHKMAEAARATGHLDREIRFIPDTEIGYLPRDKALLICTGSQGEPRAALAKIATDNHPHVVLEKDDSVIFSSRMIPGNEKSIARLQNLLAEQGVNVITAKDHFIHVSGHPCRDELAEMYRIARPRISIPVHGERRHMEEHARLALECQVSQSIVAPNGSMIRLADGKATKVDEVFHGRLAVDGMRLLPITSPVFKERKRLLFQGAVFASLVFDKADMLATEPEITILGLLDDEEYDDIIDEMIEEIEKTVRKMRARDRGNDDSVETAVRQAIRRVIREATGKKPQSEIHIARLQ